jgi:spermidine synthase
VSDTLAGLEQCSRYDLPRYKAAINQTERICWQSYYPFLYFQGQHRSNRFLIGEDAGSICIYRERYSRDRSDLMVFQLPMPFQPEVLERCLQRSMEHNKSRKASIFRIDAEDADLFRTRPDTRLAACPDEFIYDPSHYLDLSGNKNRNLRRAIHAIEGRDDIEVLDYSTRHEKECLAVMDRWIAQQQHKYDEILFHGYTRCCLRQYDRFPRRDLFGKVIRIGGEIRSFGFAGEMRRGVGNLFITYSDHDIEGLNKFINVCLLRAMDGLEQVNSSNAGDTPGLLFAKQALGPVAMHSLYQVYLEGSAARTFLPPKEVPQLLPEPNFKDRDGLRSLHLGTEWKMGLMRLAAPDALQFEYTRQMMAGLLFVDPDSVAQRHAMQLGLGAGSLTKATRNTLGIKTTAVELNPQVIELCRRAFALPPDDELMQVIAADARAVAADKARHGTVDFLQIDLYDEKSAAPLLDDVDFYADCRRLLTRNGVLAINLFGKGIRASQTMNRLGVVFGNVALWVFDKTRSGNTVVLAQYTPSRPAPNELAQRATAIEAHWRLAASEWLTRLKPWQD